MGQGRCRSLGFQPPAAAGGAGVSVVAAAGVSLASIVAGVSLASVAAGVAVASTAGTLMGAVAAGVSLVSVDWPR